MKETAHAVLSNRAGGCALDEAHAGYTLHVNNWATRDRALVLEWRDSLAESSCGRLATEPGAIALNQWVHVAFALSQPKPGGAPGKAMLFVDGRLAKSGPSGRTERDVQAARRGMTIGATTDGQYHFAGRIAQVFASRGVITPRQLGATFRLTDEAGLVEFARVARDKLLGLVLLSSRAGGTRAGAGASDASAMLAEDGPAFSALASGALQQLTAHEQAASGTVVVDLIGKSLPEGLTPYSPAKEREARDLLAQRAAARAARKAAGKSSGDDAVPEDIARHGVPGSPSPGAFDFTSGGNQWVPRTMRMPLESASGGVTDAAALAAGTFSDEVTQAELEASDKTGRERAQAVKAAMQHAWRNYKDHAWGMDELKPRSGTGDNNWSGLGMTLVDSLDTLWLMGMREEFAEARQWVATSLNFDKQGSISVFEVTIRELGGLLAAFDLSGDAIFLTKARELADRLLPAFQTASGIPRAQITLASGWAANPSWTGGSAILSELGTLQLEFRHLSKASGQPHYGRKAEAVIERLDAVNPNHGLYPIYVSTESGAPTTGAVTFGALGDSFYEYLIKVHVQGGRSEQSYRVMYDEAMEGMTSLLLKRTRPSNLAYVADWNGASTEDKMDHLVCFVPGMLALGAFTAAGTGGEPKAMRDLQNAKALAYTCWQMYERQATGIAPEFVEFPGGADLVAASRAPFYILRPEAAESLFILHQLTGNPVYREWGWKMFSAIERYCKTTFGYGAHPDVRDPSRTPDDRMESFFLAETLKYLYLLQSPDHPISLAKYTFNTEAHPLSIFTSERWDELLKG
jgi:mannosyl-oligosaccharide alpha-1,2-mannosidase